MIAEEIEKELKRMEAERAPEGRKMAGPPSPNVFEGSKLSGAGRPLVKIWQQLHENYVTWIKIQPGPLQIEDRLRFDSSDLNTLAELRDVEAEQWISLCKGIGWTPTAAVALSWCAGAQLQNTWDGWFASGNDLIPTPQSERPARLLNPELIVSTTSLSRIIEAGEKQTLPVCALIAAQTTSLVFDVSSDKLRTAQPALASFLKSRMLQGATMSAGGNDLLGIWDDKIAGTVFDIWWSKPD